MVPRMTYPKGVLYYWHYLRKHGQMRCLLAFLSLGSDTGSNTAVRTPGDLWCKLMHSPIMWPVHGYYACATGGRLYTVPWANIHRAMLPGTAAMPEKKSVR
jgi:hypothetical protein